MQTEMLAWLVSRHSRFTSLDSTRLLTLLLCAAYKLLVGHEETLLIFAAALHAY